MIRVGLPHRVFCAIRVCQDINRKMNKLITKQLAVVTWSLIRFFPDVRHEGAKQEDTFSFRIREQNENHSFYFSADSIHIHGQITNEWKSFFHDSIFFISFTSLQDKMQQIDMNESWMKLTRSINSMKPVSSTLDSVTSLNTLWNLFSIRSIH